MNNNLTTVIFSALRTSNGMKLSSCIISLIFCILFVYSHQDNARTKRTKFQNSKIPVIIDTDIGTDIDDTWAIAYLLNRPEVR